MKYMIVTVTNYYGMKGYPVIHDGVRFCVAQSGNRDKVCLFKSRDGAESVRRSFHRPSDFMVKEVIA